MLILSSHREHYLCVQLNPLKTSPEYIWLGSMGNDVISKSNHLQWVNPIGFEAITYIIWLLNEPTFRATVAPAMISLDNRELDWGSIIRFLGRGRVRTNTPFTKASPNYLHKNYADNSIKIVFTNSEHPKIIRTFFFLERPLKKFEKTDEREGKRWPLTAPWKLSALFGIAFTNSESNPDAAIMRIIAASKKCG